MSDLAPTVEAFFTQRLIGQLQASPHTVTAYRDTYRLLFVFVQKQTGKAPSQLEVADLDTPMIAAFLDHLEHRRASSARTRNARLSAIHSLFRFAALRHPEHAATIQRVLAIPQKRRDDGVVSFLTTPEIDAVLAAPDPTTRIGRRDHALLLVAIQTGLRVSELVAVCRQDLHLEANAHLRCYGKGRKERYTPLTAHTTTVLQAWLEELGGGPDTPLFPGPSGAALGRDAVRRLVIKHAVAARAHCPSLNAKRVTPHVLRHTTAMQLLQSGCDPTVIALWLGHEDTKTVQIYVHADLALKEQALARTTPPNVTAGRYQPPDPLLAFLEDL